jgi:hypothetical protein
MACRRARSTEVEITLGATAYEGRGHGGRAVTQTPRRLLVARQPSSKQSRVALDDADDGPTL